MEWIKCTEFKFTFPTVMFSHYSTILTSVCGILTSVCGILAAIEADILIASGLLVSFSCVHNQLLQWFSCSKGKVDVEESPWSDVLGYGWDLLCHSPRVLSTERNVVSVSY